MAMKFLSKKRFHVRRLENIARVAKAQAMQKEELTRMAELRREREEERDLEELRKAQEASGKVEKASKRLEWMYKTPQMRKDDETIDDAKERAKADYEALPDEAKLAFPKLDAIQSYKLPGSHFLTNYKPSLGERDIKMREDPFTQIFNKKREEEERRKHEEKLIREAEEQKKHQHMNVAFAISDCSDSSSGGENAKERDDGKRHRRRRHRRRRHRH